MTIIIGQATVPASSTVPVFRLPPGTANTTVYQPSAGNPAAVYLGETVTVSAATGMMVPVTPLNAENYVTGAGVTVFATTGSSTASSFSYIISTGGNA